MGLWNRHVCCTHLLPYTLAKRLHIFRCHLYQIVWPPRVGRCGVGWLMKKSVFNDVYFEAGKSRLEKVLMISRKKCTNKRKDAASRKENEKCLILKKLFFSRWKVIRELMCKSFNSSCARNAFYITKSYRWDTLARWWYIQNITIHLWLHLCQR